MLWPRSLRQAEHQQQKIVIRAYGRSSLRHPRQGTPSLTVYCAQNLCLGLLPSRQGDGRDTQRSD